MKRFFLFFSIVFTVAVLLVSVLYYVLNHVILQRAIAHMPYSEKLIKITSVTPWSIQGYLVLREEKQGLAIPHFEVRYNLVDLLDGQIAEVVLDSANFDVVAAGGRMYLAPFSESKESAKTADPMVLPVAVNRCVLKNCVLRIANGSKRILVDITGSVAVDYEEKRKMPEVLEADFDIVAQGLLVELQLTSKRNAAGYEHVFTAVGEDLSIVESFIPDGGSANIHGKSEIHGVIKTREDFTPVSSDVKIVVNRLNFQDKQALLGTRQGYPFEADVQFDGKTMHLAFHGLQLKSPLRINIVGTGKYSPADGSFAGYLKSEESTLPSLLTFSGNHDSEQVHLAWTAEGESWDTGSGITIIAPEGSGTINYSRSALHGDVNVHIRSVVIEEYDLSLENIDFRLDNLSADMKETVITGQGTASVGSIGVRDVELAAMTAEMKMESDQLLFNTEVQGLSIPKLNLACSGTQLAGAVTAACFLPETTVTTDDLLALVTVPEDVTFSGGISGRVDFNYSAAEFASEATVHLRDGHVTWGEDGEIFNISSTLTFPDLPNLSSLAGQQLEMEKMNIGKLAFENIKINYRVDRADSLFVERITMNWCGGRVESAGFYLNEEMTDFSTTLFCDRVGYADLLGQLGVGEAEGEGSLNGRLPIAINKDGVSFDDGFLFSTPGESGILRFSNTEIISEGMPAVDQAAYLEYSLDALRNFSYNWTKLKFTTEDHNLLLALQLDGEPVSPLPYGYKDGKIVKETVGKGIQHPIRLDVNFRVPTEDIFRYRKGIGSIMEKMK